jgi:hypothetical protein
MRELNSVEVEHVDGAFFTGFAEAFQAGYEAGVAFGQWLESIF